MSKVAATIGAAIVVIFVAGATGLAQPGKQRGGGAPHPAAPAPHAAPPPAPHFAAPAPHAAPPAPHFAAPAPRTPPPAPHFAAPAPHAAPPPAPHFAAPAPHPATHAAPPAPHLAVPGATPQAMPGAPHLAAPGTAPRFTPPRPESHFAGPKAGPQFAAPDMRPNVGRPSGGPPRSALGSAAQGAPLFNRVWPSQGSAPGRGAAGAAGLGAPNGRATALDSPRLTPDVVRRALGPAGRRPAPIATAQGGANASSFVAHRHFAANNAFAPFANNNWHSRNYSGGYGSDHG